MQLQTTKIRYWNPKAIQQINFTGNLVRAKASTMFFITVEVKETVLDFSKEQLSIMILFSI